MKKRIAAARERTSSDWSGWSVTSSAREATSSTVPAASVTSRAPSGSAQVT
ncbi:hypothetical protein [Peterkaempfera sp. SMS 1(5)a]|uniref:hypothetical protein n=1 Tax=Peterkaempfera podocarpi TaxID=3232308 RepID=UPI0036712F26